MFTESVHDNGKKLSELYKDLIHSDRLERVLNLFLRENPLSKDHDLFDYITLRDIMVIDGFKGKTLMVSGFGPDDFFAVRIELDSVPKDKLCEFTWNTIVDELELDKKGFKKFEFGGSSSQ